MDVESSSTHLVYPGEIILKSGLRLPLFPVGNLFELKYRMLSPASDGEEHNKDHALI